MSIYLRAQRTITTRDAKGRPFPITISARYRGGAYVELWFGASTDPSEVINVWDYSMHSERQNLPKTQAQLARVLSEWIEANEKDEQSYRDEDSRERFAWVVNYWQNSDQGRARWAR